LEVSGEVRQL